MGTMNMDVDDIDVDGNAVLYVVTEFVIDELDAGYQRARAMDYLMERAQENGARGITVVLDFSNTPFKMNNDAQSKKL